MKKVSDKKKVFRSEIVVRKEVNDEIQRRISYIKDELQISIEKNVWEGRKREKYFWLHADELKLLLTMNPMEKLLKQRKKLQKT